MQPELSIIIPVYNNQNCLRLLLTSIQQALDTNVGYEVIFVNDGSEDDSWEEIKALIWENSGENTIHGLNLKKNSGNLAREFTAARRGADFRIISPSSRTTGFHEQRRALICAP